MYPCKIRLDVGVKRGGGATKELFSLLKFKVNALGIKLSDYKSMFISRVVCPFIVSR